MEKAIRFKIEPPRKIHLETGDSTPEGLFADAYSVHIAKFGSVNYIITEYLLWLLNANNPRAMSTELLFNGYDGKFFAKSIKGEERKDDIEDVPVNFCGHSDPSLFKNLFVKNKFDEFINTGLCRRTMINFQPEKNLIHKPLSDKKQREINEELQKCGNELFEIFQKVPHQACYITLSEAIDVLNDYQGELIQKYNAEEDDVLRKELLSRHFKAAKLSNLFACINHPEELVINPEDVQQAIEMVEYLSGDLKLLLNYNPKKKDLYDKLYDIFKENIDKKLTKTEITNYRYKDIQIPREKLRNCFDELISCVKELAANDGYILFEDNKSLKNGVYYTLKKYVEPKLSDGVQGLEELLS